MLHVICQLQDLHAQIVLNMFLATQINEFQVKLSCTLVGKLIMLTSAYFTVNQFWCTIINMCIRVYIVSIVYQSSDHWAWILHGTSQKFILQCKADLLRNLRLEQIACFYTHRSHIFSILNAGDPGLTFLHFSLHFMLDLSLSLIMVGCLFGGI